MVNLTRIYTRTGDDGQTHLGDMSRTSKTDVRLLAYADANEATPPSASPWPRVSSPRTCAPRCCGSRTTSSTSAPTCARPLQETYEYPPLRVEPGWIDELEADCDRYLERVEKLRSFILPGGTVGSAHLHVATTVVRRAERQAWAAIAHYGEQPGSGKGEGGVNVLTAKYLNRLSDLLFVLARVANLPIGGDVLWQPGGGRAEGRPALNSTRCTTGGPRPR